MFTAEMFLMYCIFNHVVCFHIFYREYTLPVNIFMGCLLVTCTPDSPCNWVTCCCNFMLKEYSTDKWWGFFNKKYKKIHHSHLKSHAIHCSELQILLSKKGLLWVNKNFQFPLGFTKCLVWVSNYCQKSFCLSLK